MSQSRSQIQSVEYRHLKIGEENLVQDLFESFYSPGIYCTERRYFDWLHRDHPQRLNHVADDELTVFGAISPDGLLGCVCYTTSKVHVAGQEHSAVITTESLTRAGSGGVFGLLARRLFGRFDYGFVMGATPFLRDLYVKQLGAAYSHEMARHLLIGDVAALGRLVELNPEGLEVDLRELESWRESALRCADGQAWVGLEDIGEICGAYWQSFRESGLASLRRDPAWLAWRYGEHPHIDYRIIAAEPSQSSGIAIIRHERIEEADVEFLRLLEFLPTAGGKEALVGAVAKYVQDSGAACLDFFCAHDSWLGDLPSAFMAPDEHAPFQIPYLLQPPEWRERTSINLLALRHRRHRKTLPMLGDGDIYLTKGDGAQDIALNKDYHSAHLRGSATDGHGKDGH